MPGYLTNQFIRSIKNSPRNCILFVGAGLSVKGVRENGEGFPTWRQLIETMIEDLKDSRKCDASTLKEIDTYYTNGDYLKIAEIYRTKTRSDQYSAFLKEQLDPKDLSRSVIHEQILSIDFRGIITTNFDCVFEHNSNTLSPLVYPQAFKNVETFREHGFFAKIHGCVRQTYNMHDDLILSEYSYLMLRNNPQYQTILKSLFLMYPILTVGFSLTDPDFLSLIEDLKEIFPAPPTIYALVKTDNEQVKEEWLAKGVDIIAYNEHEHLHAIFEELKNLGNKNDVVNNDAGSETSPAKKVESISNPVIDAPAVQNKPHAENVITETRAQSVETVITKGTHTPPPVNVPIEEKAQVSGETHHEHPKTTMPVWQKISLVAVAAIALTAIAYWGYTSSATCKGWECDGSYTSPTDTSVSLWGKSISIKKNDTLVVRNKAVELKPYIQTDELTALLSSALAQIGDSTKTDDERQQLVDLIWKEYFSDKSTVSFYENADDFLNGRNATEFWQLDEVKKQFLPQLARMKTLTILKIVKDVNSGKVAQLSVCLKK